MFTQCVCVRLVTLCCVYSSCTGHPFSLRSATGTGASGRRDQTDSTYQPSAEVRHTREERYQLRSWCSTVVIDDSGSDLGDVFIARPEVKVE